MAQDSDKKTESSGQGQSGKSEQSTESKTSSKSGQESKSETQAEKQASESKSKPQVEKQASESRESKEAGNSLLQVLDFLKNSNLINLDMPLKSLFDQVQHIQTDPSSEWGLIGDSGHWALVWQKKHD